MPSLLFYIYFSPQVEKKFCDLVARKPAEAGRCMEGCKSRLTNCFYLKGPQKFTCTEKVTRKRSKLKFNFSNKKPVKVRAKNDNKCLSCFHFGSESRKIYIYKDIWLWGFLVAMYANYAFTLKISLIFLSSKYISGFLVYIRI